MRVSSVYRSMTSQIVIGTALAALAVLAGCSGAASSTSPQTVKSSPTLVTVSATPDSAFAPPLTSVQPGGTVTFAFGSLGHTVFFDATTGAPADIATVSSNTSVSRTFNTPGTFNYTCHVHPGMHGTIVVNSVAADTTGTGGNYRYNP